MSTFRKQKQKTYVYSMKAKNYMVSTCCHAKPSLNIQMCGMRIEAAGGQKVTVFEEHVHSFPSHGIESCNEKKRISRQDARDTNKNVIAGINADSN